MTLTVVGGAHARQSADANGNRQPKFKVSISTVGDSSLRAPQSSFTAGQPVFVQLDLTNETAADLPIIMGDPFKQLRLKLTRDGKKVAFSKDAEARLDPEREKSPLFHGNALVTLKPSATLTAEVINLGDFYGVLEPGSYELTIWRVWKGGHKSNTVSFEVAR